MNDNLSVALIRAVIHAFYPDSYIAIVEILINDKFLREDDMDLRLSLPSRAIRKILEALRAERLVSVEIADDTSGDRNVKFWYIDYNLAVRVITYRIYLLQSRLNASAASTRSSAVFLCPSYSAGLCHGKYNEHEATRYVDFSDPNRARFLCHECKRREDTCSTFADIETYTLKQVDVGGKEGDLKVLKNKVQTQVRQIFSFPSLYPFSSYQPPHLQQTQHKHKHKQLQLLALLPLLSHPRTTASLDLLPPKRHQFPNHQHGNLQPPLREHGTGGRHEANTRNGTDCCAQ